MADEERPFGLPDDAFWGRMWSREQDLLDRVYTLPRALLADGPRRVALDARDSAPVGVLHYAPTLHHARAPWENHALVVALRDDDGLLLAGAAEDRLPMVPPVPPGLTEDSGHSVYRRGADLFSRPGVPREAGSWSVWFLLGDFTSNRVRVDLVGGPARTRAPLCRRPRPAPGDPLPRFDAVMPPPREHGMELAVPRQAGLSVGPTGELGSTGPIEVRGAARLAWPPPGMALPSPEEGDGPVCAPLTLLVTGSLRRGPAVLRLQVPVHEVTPGVAVAAFAVDLAAFPEVPLDAQQTLFLFAYAPGGAATGPYPLELLREEDAAAPRPGD